MLLLIIFPLARYPLFVHEITYWYHEKLGDHASVLDQDKLTWLTGDIKLLAGLMSVTTGAVVSSITVCVIVYV